MGRPNWRVHLQVCDRVQILTDSLSLCLQFDENNQTKHWTYFYHWDPHHPIRTLHPSLYSVLNDSWHSTVCHQVGIIIIDYLTKNVRLKKKNLRWKPQRFYLESQDQQDINLFRCVSANQQSYLLGHKTKMRTKYSDSSFFSNWAS